MDRCALTIYPYSLGVFPAAASALSGMETRMRDTAHLEHTAEDCVSFKLQQAGFLIAKPKFDRDGTDLIALLSVKDGAKFGRIQCKGRSLKNHKTTTIKIPCEYVIGPFFVFAYIDYKIPENLFVFFREDIQKWKEADSHYVLNITRKDILNK